MRTHSQTATTIKTMNWSVRCVCMLNRIQNRDINLWILWTSLELRTFSWSTGIGLNKMAYEGFRLLRFADNVWSKIWLRLRWKFAHHHHEHTHREHFCRANPVLAFHEIFASNLIGHKIMVHILWERVTVVVVAHVFHLDNFGIAFFLCRSFAFADQMCYVFIGLNFDLNFSMR